MFNPITPIPSGLQQLNLGPDKSAANVKYQVDYAGYTFIMWYAKVTGTYDLGFTGNVKNTDKRNMQAGTLALAVYNDKGKLVYHMAMKAPGSYFVFDNKFCFVENQKIIYFDTAALKMVTGLELKVPYPATDIHYDFKEANTDSLIFVAKSSTRIQNTEVTKVNNAVVDWVNATYHTNLPYTTPATRSEFMTFEFEILILPGFIIDDVQRFVIINNYYWKGYKVGGRILVP